MGQQPFVRDGGRVLIHEADRAKVRVGTVIAVGPPGALVDYRIVGGAWRRKGQKGGTIWCVPLDTSNGSQCRELCPLNYGMRWVPETDWRTMMEK